MKGFNVIAHRGANENAPQNTIPAFLQAIEENCDGFETDIHLTKDGFPVVCHNFTIDETSNGTGDIGDFTLAQLREFDFGSYKDKKFEGTKIPTLDEFLETYKKKPMNVLDIELKSKIPGKAGTDIAKKVIDKVIEHGLLDDLLISSFDPALLVVCKKLDKRVKTGILYSPDKHLGRMISLHPFSFAKEINCDALHPFWMYATPSYVKRAHSKGLQVNPWTVNSEPVAKFVIKAGVDGLITDCPAKINEYINKYATDVATIND